MEGKVKGTKRTGSRPEWHGPASSHLPKGRSGGGGRGARLVQPGGMESRFPDPRKEKNRKRRAGVRSGITQKKTHRLAKSAG